jgi:hypothetical protein
VAVVGLLAILPLLPNLPIETAPLNTPKFFTSTDVQKIPSGALAFTLPYDIAPQNDAMMWQAASGMRFRMLGGDAFVRGAGGRSTWHWEPAGPKVLLAVLHSGRYHSTAPPPMTRGAIAAVRALLAREHVSVVLVGPASREGPALAALMKQVLGVPTWHQGRMEVWLNVQRDLQRPTG